MRALVLLLALVSVTVASPQRPDVEGGPYAKYLSEQGVLEIAAIPNHHENIRKPVYYIRMTDRDRAEVYSGRRPQIGDHFTAFEVRRKAGHWRLVPGSIHDTERVRTYSHIIPAPGY